MASGGHTGRLECGPFALREYLGVRGWPDKERCLKKQLPDYMVPAAFVQMEALPLTPNGKVDRRALPEPDQVRPKLESSYVAARTPMEQTLVDIWKEVLKVEQIGVHDNFFELGGHSLRAIQMISQIDSTFKVEMPLQVLFEAPTVASVAAAIAQKQAEQRDSETLARILSELEELSPEEVNELLSLERMNEEKRYD